MGFLVRLWHCVFHPERGFARVAEEAPSGRTPVHPARYVVEATKAFDQVLVLSLALMPAPP